MNPEELALSNCDSEPIHIPGKVQSFAGVLGLDPNTFEIRHQSDNFLELLPGITKEPLGLPLDGFCDDRDLFHRIRGAMGMPSIAQQRERIGVCRLGARNVDIAVNKTDTCYVVEFEPVLDAVDRKDTPIARVRSLLACLQTADNSTASLIDVAVKTLRRVTGYDRVMGYRFLANGDGEVISEARSPGVKPFLGLRYPASDIPRPVRDIMVRVPFRTISDVHDPHAGILTNCKDLPLDLSLAHARGVSPIHVEYLGNMGVRATMNVAIIVHGELWGIFAFHHYSPKHLGPDERSVCEIFGHFVSLQIQQQLEKDVFTSRKRADSTIKALNRQSETRLPVVFDQFSREFAEITESDGVAYVDDRELRIWGSVPESSVTRYLRDASNDEVYAVESLVSLPDVVPAATQRSAGALVLQLSEESSAYLIFYRDEIVTKIRWAGEPEKDIRFGPNGPRLHPRASFAEYAESVSGRCKAWTKGNISSAMAIRTSLRDLDYSANSNATNELKGQKEYQDLLIAELNHRVRNLLSLVRSIARQSKSSSTSIEQYAEMFGKRIAALSSAHDLIGQSGVQWARLDEIFEVEVNAFSGADIPISLGGPRIVVSSSMAPLIALLVHELTTNAAKYGALSERGQRLDVAWEDESGGVRIRWVEQIDGVLTPPTSRGFGLSLIERAVPHECGGDCTVEFTSTGLHVSFWLPNDTARASQDEAAAVKVPPVAEDTSLRLDDSQVALVVEDNIILAMETEQTLEELGFGSVLVYADPDTCLREIQDVEIHAAVLDIDLGGITSFKVAAFLCEQNVPFVFVSGFDSNYNLPPEFAKIARLTKPVDREKLGVALRDVLKEQP